MRLATTSITDWRHGKAAAEEAAAEWAEGRLLAVLLGSPSLPAPCCSPRAVTEQSDSRRRIGTCEGSSSAGSSRQWGHRTC